MVFETMFQCKWVPIVYKPFPLFKPTNAFHRCKIPSHSYRVVCLMGTGKKWAKPSNATNTAISDTIETVMQKPIHSFSLPLTQTNTWNILASWFERRFFPKNHHNQCYIIPFLFALWLLCIWIMENAVPDFQCRWASTTTNNILTLVC